MEKDVYIDILYKPMLNNFKPVLFYFGKTSSTERFYIGCRYSYTSARNTTQFGQCLLAYTPEDMKGRYKVVGITNDDKVQLRKLRELIPF